MLELCCGFLAEAGMLLLCFSRGGSGFLLAELCVFCFGRPLCVDVVSFVIVLAY